MLNPRITVYAVAFPDFVVHELNVVAYATATNMVFASLETATEMAAFLNGGNMVVTPVHDVSSDDVTPSLFKTVSAGL